MKASTRGSTSCTRSWLPAGTSSCPERPEEGCQLVAQLAGHGVGLPFIAGGEERHGGAQQVEQARLDPVGAPGERGDESQPALRLVVAIADDPVPRAGDDEADGEVGKRGAGAVAQRAREVVFFGVEPGDGVDDVGAAQRAIPLAGAPRHEPRLRDERLGEVAPRGEPIDAVLAHRFEGAESTAAALQQRPVDQ